MAIATAAGSVGDWASIELMMMSPKIRELTFNSAPTEEIRRAALAEGMKTLYWDGIDKVLRGITTLEEVLRQVGASGSEGRTNRFFVKALIIGSRPSAANNLCATPTLSEQSDGTGFCRAPGAHTFSGSHRQMSTILIDKLLETVVIRKASDLHITVGQPPVLRLDGRMQRLETKVLEAGRHRGA